MSSLLACALGAIAFPAGGEAAEYIDETRPVDVKPNGALPANEGRGKLDISDDGRYVLFVSSSNELTDHTYPVSPYGAPIWHLFRRDMLTGEVELVDVNSAGRVSKRGAIGGEMSADGNEIVFRAPGSELGPEPLPDEIYVRDMTTGGLELVNRADGPEGDPVWRVGSAVSISADGSKVAFVSYDPDIDPDVEVPPNSDVLHVYVRDLEAGTTEFVDCLGADPCVPSSGNRSMESIQLSDSGRYVLFDTYEEPRETCIDRPELDYACSQFYVRDMQERTTTLASQADGESGEPGNSYASVAYLSGDGRHVAFDTASTNLGAELPPNNQYLGMQWTYVRDIDAATTKLVSRADGLDGAAAATGAFVQGISRDGDDVIFASSDDALAGFPRDNGHEAFVRHVGAGRTELVSRRDGGFGIPSETSPDGTTSGYGAISAGGDFVVFSSSDPALTGVPGFETSHVFRRQITGQPAPPVAEEKVQLHPDDGAVEVRIPGSPYFEELERGTQVPLGSVIDAGDGALEILSEDPDPEQPLRHMVWSDGEFVTDQETDGEALSEAILNGPLLDCDNPERITPRQLREMGGHPGEDVVIPGRKLWGKGGKGHKSKGGKSSATVRGTEWLVWDTCDGRTVTYVVEGRVEVRDFDRGRTVFVDPGEIYVAPGPPDTAITNGPSGTILNSTPSFWFDAGAEAWSDHLCRIDEGAWSSCSSPWTSPALDPGVHTFSVRATDDAGSTGVEPAIRAFKVDREADPDPDPPVFEPPVGDLDTRAPRTRITSGPGDRVTAKRAAEVRFRFASDEDGSTFQCKLDDSDWRRCTSPKDLRLKPGRHRFEVRAIDPTGNVDATPERQSVRVVRR